MNKLIDILTNEIKIVPASRTYNLNKQGVKASNIRVGDILQYTDGYGRELEGKVLDKYEIDPIIKRQHKLINNKDTNYKFTIQGDSPNQYIVWLDYEIEDYWKNNSSLQREIKIVPIQPLLPGWKERKPFSSDIIKTYIKDDYKIYIINISSPFRPEKYGTVLRSRSMDQSKDEYSQFFDKYGKAEKYAFELMDKINKKEITEIKIVPAPRIHDLDKQGVKANNINVGDIIQFTIKDNPFSEDSKTYQQVILSIPKTTGEPGSVFYNHFRTQGLEEYKQNTDKNFDFWSISDIENWWSKYDDVLEEIKIEPIVNIPTSPDKGNIYAEYPSVPILEKTKDLLYNIYTTLKPIENQFDEKIRLSPSVNRPEVELRYGYWDRIDNLVASTLINSDKFEIIPDVETDEDRGMVFNYIILNKENVDEIKIVPTASMKRINAGIIKYVQDNINENIIDIIQNYIGNYLATNQGIATTMFEDDDLNPVLENYLKAHMLQNEVEIIRNGEVELLDSSNIDTLTEQELFEYLNDNKEIQKMLSKTFWKYYFDSIDVDEIKKNTIQKITKIIKDDDEFENEWDKKVILDRIFYFIDQNIFGTKMFPYPDDIFNSFKFIEYLEKTLSTTDISEIKINPVTTPKAAYEKWKDVTEPIERMLRDPEFYGEGVKMLKGHLEHFQHPFNVKAMKADGWSDNDIEEYLEAFKFLFNKYKISVKEIKIIPISLQNERADDIVDWDDEAKEYIFNDKKLFSILEKYIDAETLEKYWNDFLEDMFNSDLSDYDNIEFAKEWVDDFKAYVHHSENS